MQYEIKNFESLIERALKPGQKYVSHSCEKLLSSGENYGSIMLRVQVKILTRNGDQNLLHCVAKTCPPRGYLWEVFNTRETFKTEIAIYEKVVPELNNFGKEKGINHLIDCLPKFVAARVSLDEESSVVDEDAVLILENLKVQGYDILDRFVGLDLDCTKLVLRDLATLHAAPIAYKFQKPGDFEKNILPHLGKCFVFEINDKTIEDLIELVTKSVSIDPNCAPYASKLEKYVRNINIAQIKPNSSNPLFSTIAHNDYWLNNTMIRYERNKPIGNRIVDFQINDFSSLTHDLIFFLYSSVELDILERHLDKLFRYYYDIFIETLTKLGQDTSAYTFDIMMEECGIMAKEVELPHLIMLLPSIFLLKEKSEELSEIKSDDFIAKGDSLHPNFDKRMQFILLDFVKRGWI
ncbi:hypothetical protein Trydic_g13036 [Trypoxylus dichotomus]